MERTLVVIWSNNVNLQTDEVIETQGKAKEFTKEIVCVKEKD